MLPLEAFVLQGVVVAIKANYFQVEIDFSNDKKSFEQIKIQRLLCTKRKKLDHQGITIYVGDKVYLESIDWNYGSAVITKVAQRKTFLSRPPIANVTKVLVVLSFKKPKLDFDQASRFLLKAEETGLNVGLILNKIDLLNNDELMEYSMRFRSWGYRPLFVSASTGEGFQSLVDDLEMSKLSVFCGPSGVGKTSLLNRLFPNAGLRIADVSGRLQRGRHTTRNIELFNIGCQSKVADTPGFNRPELVSKASDLAKLFPEIRSQIELTNCRFRDCLHRDEPGCAVNKDWERYIFYRNCIERILNISQ